MNQPLKTFKCNARNGFRSFERNEVWRCKRYFFFQGICKFLLKTCIDHASGFVEKAKCFKVLKNCWRDPTNDQVPADEPLDDVDPTRGPFAVSVYAHAQRAPRQIMTICFGSGNPVRPKNLTVRLRGKKTRCSGFPTSQSINTHSERPAVRLGRAEVMSEVIVTSPIV